MAFQLENFIEQFNQTPSLELISSLRKSDLLVVGKHYGLEVKQAMRKDEIKKIVVEHLVDDNVLPPDVLQQLPSVTVGTDFEIRKLEMELHYRLEAKRLEEEQENKRLEAEQENKRLEAEQENKRLETENKRIEAGVEQARLEAEVALR